ncbi:type 1 fimbrial protein [Ralstonia insidiosa]|nr:type 1 fimbrial protein [Ralstonia insidiosa]
MGFVGLPVAGKRVREAMPRFGFPISRKLNRLVWRTPTSMNKIAIALAATLALGIAASAQAADGTITFDGEVLSTSCKIDVAGEGAANATITLPNVAATSLATAGSRASEVPFNIVVGGPGADACTQSNVKAYFHRGANVNAAGRLSNTTGTGQATNVDVVLMNSKRQDINLLDNTNSETIAITSGSATIPLYGQYYATGAATAGLVDTSVEYSVIYP